MKTSECAGDRLREFTGIIWVDDQPGVRFSLVAVSWQAARDLICDRWGTDHFYVLRDEEGARRPRGWGV